MKKPLLIALLLVIGGVTMWLVRQRAQLKSIRAISAANIPLVRNFLAPTGPKRVARAQRAKRPTVAERCRAAGLPLPPRELFLRAFKGEAHLEVWGRENRERFDLIATYPVLASSGAPGPKRREGDRQVPEGFYEIDQWNPESRFHLSLRVNYPNDADRKLSDPRHPGSDIYIHGGSATIGCLPIGDDAIEELYILTLAARERGQARIPLHIYPMRMAGGECERLASRHPGSRAFWQQLKLGYDTFEYTRLVPEISVAEDGSYIVKIE